MTGVGLHTVVLAFLFFNSVSETKKRSTENLKLTSQLQDSISNLQSQLKQTSVKEPIVNPKQSETVIEYKVRFGDYPSKIAQFFFNDWKMYKKIEADNNLVQPYTLKVGQTLKIKIPQ
ncbi:MAG: LysM peptidoglycan-binding domain-containing protein [Bacteroidetes bacterium]|nr:LysM peptidoglycan-binding domain-containing protein [Bacteroidota bacterium]